MGTSRFWISFHHQDEQVDHWALYLDTEKEADCDIWQASGQTFEFEQSHHRGLRPESVPNFREKWVIKDKLTETEIQVIRQVAGSHPVDNEGAYWDCRVFCFEVLAILETKNLLSRSDNSYREIRKQLHEKWKSDDGVSVVHSDRSESEDSDDDEPDLTRVNDSDLENESVNGDDTNDDTTVEKHGNPNHSGQVISKKRTLSCTTSSQGGGTMKKELTKRVERSCSQSPKHKKGQ